MKKLLFALLAVVVLLSSCSCSSVESNYKIVDSDGYKYYTDSYKITQTNCIEFTGKNGYTDGRKVNLCGTYTIIDNTVKP